MVMMRSRWSLLPLACCLISWVASSAVAAAGTTVNSLPGFDGPLPFSLETGYVEVKETTGVNLFYYFIHSEKDPEHDPLFLWMTGGPGCSSLCGLTYEIGPFQFSAQWHYRNGVPKLIYHPETWTKTNNIIFVILLWGQDSRTQPQRKDSSLWLVDHPQFLLNPLYIGGDSYGGMIIPVLTLAIDERNYLGEKPYFNLKGYLVGNPRTDKQFDEDAKIPFFHGMGLISNELYERAKETCSGKYSAPSNIQCVQSLKSINDKAAYIVLKIWVNDETVRENLGVRKGTVGDWKRCNYVGLHYVRDIHSTVEYHSTLMRKGYRALIYSGDHDAGFTFIGTQAWIRFLNLSVAEKWRPWYLAGQVAGFTTSYASNNLTYATVKGAGHTAPEYKPKECFAMFTRWISGKSL
uniref:Serine carboxypeptidase-like 19 n=1 Tax=Leersia perrieri TaxID=77586 RepID=A0A0D9XRX0_9ORYZ